MTDELTYQQDRAAILATAVGIARLKLKHGDAAGALKALDVACEKAHRLHFDYELSRGHTVDQVELLLGKRDR